MRLEVDRELLERVVAHDLRALEGTRPAASYRAAANRVYAEKDEARREDAFARLNLELFHARGHDRAVLELIQTEPRVAALQRVLLVAAPQRRDEDVDLVAGDLRTLRLRLTADRFAEPAALRAFLRRQLVQVADLLDPAFGYARIERLAANPAEDNLLRDRYRLFWELSVLGRLGGEEAARERCRLHAELAALYARVTPAARERIFERLVGGPRPVHAELLAAARDTDRLLALAGLPSDPVASGPQPGHPCPLCQFSTHAWRRAPLAAPVVRAIREHSPAWDPSRGLCERCADLYELRQPAPVAS